MTSINGRTLNLGFFRKEINNSSRTIACPSTYTVQAAIQEIHPVDDGGDGIGKGQLLIVVAVDADGFLRHVLHILLGQNVYVLRIKGAETVHQIDYRDAAFGQVVQGLFQVPGPTVETAITLIVVSYPLS